MTRYRFVKLLMSHGVSRNRANEIAQRTRSRGGYTKGYKIWVAVNDIGGPLTAMAEALNSAAEAFTDVTKALHQIAISTGAATQLFSSLSAAAMQGPEPFGGICTRCGGTGVEKRMQSLAQIGGPSVRGPDLFGMCPQCFGTGRNLHETI